MTWDRLWQPEAQQERFEIRQGGNYLIQESRSSLEAKRGLDLHPNHHGESTEGRDRTQEERRLARFSLGLGFQSVSTPPPHPCEEIQRTSTCFRRLYERHSHPTDAVLGNQ